MPCSLGPISWGDHLAATHSIFLHWCRRVNVLDSSASRNVNNAVAEFLLPQLTPPSLAFNKLAAFPIEAHMTITPPPLPIPLNAGGCERASQSATVKFHAPESPVPGAIGCDISLTTQLQCVTASFTTDLNMGASFIIHHIRGLGPPKPMRYKPPCLPIALWGKHLSMIFRKGRRIKHEAS